MANLPIHSPLDFNTILRMLETTDLSHADTFNPLFERLLNNDAFMNSLISSMKTKLDGIAANANNYVHPSTHPATMINVADTKNYFVATTVEGVLEELFQLASNGKLLVANAITGKGIPASAQDTFQQLAAKIAQIIVGYPVGDSVEVRNLAYGEKTVWKYVHNEYVDALLIGNEDRIFIFTIRSKQLACIDRNGKKVWSTIIDDGSFGSLKGYLDSNGYLVIAGADKGPILKRINQSGTILWSRFFGEGLPSYSIDLMGSDADGNVYFFVDGTKTLHKVSGGTGNDIWKLTLTDPLVGAVSLNGYLYTGYRTKATIEKRSLSNGSVLDTILITGAGNISKITSMQASPNGQFLYAYGNYSNLGELHRINLTSKEDTLIGTFLNPIEITVMRDDFLYVRQKGTSTGLFNNSLLRIDPAGNVSLSRSGESDTSVDSSDNWYRRKNQGTVYTVEKIIPALTILK